MRLEPLTEICKSRNNGDDDEDDTYFPTVQELIAGRGVGGGHASKAVDKPALDNSDRSINPDEFILGLNSGNSQSGCANSSSLWISSLTIYRQSCLCKRG
jgi:hypothetical protein